MLNHITLMGRMTHNPELRYTPQNTPVASFSLAVERDYQPGGAEKQTDFIDCVAWRKTAEFVSKYFQKGSMAVISCRLHFRDTANREGCKRKLPDVPADNTSSGESAKAKPAGAPVDAAPPSFEELAETEGGELPF